jgi:hypothetical protein
MDHLAVAKEQSDYYLKKYDNDKTERSRELAMKYMDNARTLIERAETELARLRRRNEKIMMVLFFFLGIVVYQIAMEFLK